jgi:NTP pyrophosphatase (non-canonical NTP hydrolase)
MSKSMEFILREIKAEREKQDKKWGEQNHHPLLWFSIIGEEFGEMCHAFNEYSFDTENMNLLEDMQHEAVQVAACCVAMLECLDRMGERGYVADMPAARKEGNNV